MSAATDSGEVIEYKMGDPIPGVEAWPMFEHLKNIGWIVATFDAADQAGQPGARPVGRSRAKFTAK